MHFVHKLFFRHLIPDNKSGDNSARFSPFSTDFHVHLFFRQNLPLAHSLSSTSPRMPRDSSVDCDLSRQPTALPLTTTFIR